MNRWMDGTHLNAKLEQLLSESRCKGVGGLLGGPIRREWVEGREVSGDADVVENAGVVVAMDGLIKEQGQKGLAAANQAVVVDCRDLM